MKGLFSGLVEDSSRSFILSFVVGSLLAAGSSPRARSEVIHLQVHTGSRKYYHKTWPDMKCFCGYFFSCYANGLLSTLKLCFWFLSLSLAFTNLLQRFSVLFSFQSHFISGRNFELCIYVRREAVIGGQNSVKRRIVQGFLQQAWVIVSFGSLLLTGQL